MSVDIARAEPGEADVEGVDAIVLTEAFGVTGPAHLPCLPLRFHVAQKLHGMTLPPRPGRRNERFRDLIDLLLMETLVAADVHWDEPFAQLAAEVQLAERDVATALARVRALVERILAG